MLFSQVSNVLTFLLPMIALGCSSRAREARKDSMVQGAVITFSFRVAMPGYVFTLVQKFFSVYNSAEFIIFFNVSQTHLRS